MAWGLSTEFASGWQSWMGADFESGWPFVRRVSRIQLQARYAPTITLEA